MFSSRRKVDRTYSLTSYTGVGAPPPNRQLPNPAAVAAASSVSFAGSSGSVDSRLSSAAAATALKRHNSLTSGSLAAAQAIQRQPPSGTTVRRTASTSSTPRATTTSTVETRGRTMSLTTTTVRNLGSFQLISTKTIPLNKAPPRRTRPASSGALSFESDLNPVSEEDVSNTEFFPSSPKANEHKHVSQVPRISFPALPEEGPPAAVKYEKPPIKHVPPPRSVSPMKPALKDTSSQASISSSEGELRRKRSNRVSFSDSEDIELVRSYPSREFLKPQPVRIEAAGAATAAKTHKLLGGNNPSGSTMRRSNAAAAAARSVGKPRVEDSDSGNSVYSDAFEDPLEAEINHRNLEAMRVKKKQINLDGGEPRGMPQHRQQSNGSIRPKKKVQRPESQMPRSHDRLTNDHAQRTEHHHYRALTEDSDTDVGDIDDISLNSDSSWKRERPSAATTPGSVKSAFKRHSLRDEGPLSSAVVQASLSATSRPLPNGFKAHSLRSNTARPDFSHLESKTTPAEPVSVHRTNSSSSFERVSRRSSAAGKFARMSLREPKVVKPVPVRPTQPAAAPMADALTPFRSRILDSDSEDEMAMANIHNTIPPHVEVAHQHLAPAHGLKSIFSSNKAANAKSDSRSHRRAAKAARKEMALEQQKLSQYEMLADMPTHKKKKFPTLRRVFRLDP
jgi:hypothetical protein